MKKVLLRVIEDPCNGKLGLAIKSAIPSLMNVDGPIVADGSLIAHDLLEHVGGVDSIGGIGEEVIALGAMWYVRGRHGFVRNNDSGYRPPSHHIASDISEMFFRVSDLGFGCKPKNTRAGDYEEDFQDILEETKSNISSESEYNESTAIGVDDYLDTCIHFLREGFRKARKKYRCEERLNLFKKISEAVDSCAIDWEGQEYMLSYSTDEAWVEEFYEFDY